MVKLVQNGFVEAFADAVCLRVTRSDLRMLDVVYAQIQLVRFQLPAILRSPVGQDTAKAHFLRGKKR